MPYRPTSIQFWKAYWITMRPYLLFISGIAGLSGMALVKSPNPAIVLAAFVPLFFSYGLGQALTDVFQTDTDSISSPYRPLVRGEIRRGDVLLISVVALTAGVLMLAVINWRILIFGFLAVLGLATYTYFKKRWWGGPPWNSWIVALLPMIGRLIDPDFHPITEILSLTPNGRALLWTMAAAFFAYANFVVMGYFKDISADRTTGYETVQVKFGWMAGVIYSDIVSIGAVISTIMAISSVITPSILSIPALAFFVMAMAVNIRAQVLIRKTRDEKKTAKPIEDTVRSFLLYMSAIISAYKVEWMAFLIVYYIVFEFALSRRPEVTQI